MAEINPHVLEHFSRRDRSLPGAIGVCKLQASMVLIALLVLASIGSLVPHPVLFAALAIQLTFISPPLIFYYLWSYRADDLVIAARVLTETSFSSTPSKEQVVSALGERRAEAALRRLSSTQILTASSRGVT